MYLQVGGVMQVKEFLRPSHTDDFKLQFFFAISGTIFVALMLQLAALEI